MTSSEAAAYEEAILAAIAKENRQFENDRGLAEYIHDEALSQKVHSLYPSVEIVDGELWGVMTAGLKESLSSKETAGLLDFICGQNADGYVPNNMRRSRPKSWLTPILMVFPSSHIILQILWTSLKFE